MMDIQNLAKVARRISGVALSALAECDARADGGTRDVACTRQSIIICRKVSGISMQIDIPKRAYMGVALSIIAGDDGSPIYRIAMPHTDPALAIVLYEARDDRDIIAVWKAWANYFGLARLTEQASGKFENCETFVGATSMGSRPLWRRRGATLAKRKPTQRSRRRNAHAILKPFVLAGVAPTYAEN